MAGQQGLQVMSPADAGSALAPSQPAGSSMDISPLAGGNPPQTMTPLKEENDLLRKTLREQEQQLQATNQLARDALQQQRDGFQRAASEFQHEAREVRNVEVAQQRVMVQGQMQGALSQTKRQLQF
jgi:hypothetical protein